MAKQVAPYVTRSGFCSLKDRPVTIIVTSTGVPFQKCPFNVTCGAPTSYASGRLQALRDLNDQTLVPPSPPMGKTPSYSITLDRSVALEF